MRIIRDRKRVREREISPEEDKYTKFCYEISNLYTQSQDYPDHREITDALQKALKLSVEYMKRRNWF